MLDIVQVTATSPALPRDIVRIGAHVFTVLRVDSSRLYMQTVMDGVSPEKDSNKCWVHADDVRYVHRLRDANEALRRHIHPNLAGRYSMKDFSELSLTLASPILSELLNTSLTITPQSGDTECLLWAIEFDCDGCVVANLQGASIPTSDRHFDLCVSGEYSQGLSASRVQMNLSFKGSPHHPDDRPSQIAFRIFVYQNDSETPSCAVGVLNPLTT